MLYNTVCLGWSSGVWWHRNSNRSCFTRRQAVRWRSNNRCRSDRMIHHISAINSWSGSNTFFGWWRRQLSSIPSLFVGRRYDSGPKSHKGVYLVVDYAAVKSQKSGYSVALSVPCEEVYVPPGDPILPLHAAAETALADFSEANLYN